MEQIKALNTIYNGHRFRSRLEARWAVFFDTVGIKYQYETEGYKLSDGTCYLPDFYLPEDDVWIEVKRTAKAIQEEEWHKIELFARSMCDITTSGTRFRLLIDEPKIIKWTHTGILIYLYIHPAEIAKAFNIDPPKEGSFSPALWLNPGWRDNEDKLEKAVLRAKQARFEHGEKP